MTPQRRNRLILVTALVLIVLSLLWAARSEMFPFIFALVLAYILLPLVNLFDRELRRLLPRFRGARPAAILLSYLVAMLVVIAFFRLLLPVIGQQFNALWENREEIVGTAQQWIDQGLVWYRETVPADIQAQIDTAAAQAGARLAGAVQTALVQTISAVTSTVTFVIGLVIVPIWLFYILYDQSRFMRAAIQLVPETIRTDVVNLARIADNILSKYLRGQLFLCVVVGLVVTLGLSFLGVNFPVVLGVVAGMFEILPFVGPFIGAVPAVLVALMQQPLLAVWTILLFLVIQQVENAFLVPRISGKAVELHPALIIVVLIVGSRVAGLWGAIMAVPLTAIIRDGFKYLYLRFLDSPIEPEEAMARVSKAPLQLDV